jgi:hypothetical protein
MFVICLILFVGGIILMGLSFSLVPFQALFFVLGLLAVAVALAIPIHTSQASLRK